MPWPSIVNFGIVDNPLIDSPFVESSEKIGMPPPAENDFLLLNGNIFGLLGGGNLLLL